jgi:hypothetical protein
MAHAQQGAKALLLYVLQEPMQIQGAGRHPQTKRFQPSSGRHCCDCFLNRQHAQQEAAAPSSSSTQQQQTGPMHRKQTRKEQQVTLTGFCGLSDTTTASSSLSRSFEPGVSSHTAVMLLCYCCGRDCGCSWDLCPAVSPGCFNQSAVKRKAVILSITG